MTEEQINEKALEAYPEKFVQMPFCISANDINGDHREGYKKALNDIESLPKIKGWVVRDECGLWLYREKPYRVEGTFCSHWTDKNGPNSELPLDINIFPELTLEDEPIEVEILIRKP